MIDAGNVSGVAHQGDEQTARVARRADERTHYPRTWWNDNPGETGVGKPLGDVNRVGRYQFQLP
jgi:hypothetical protein